MENQAEMIFQIVLLPIESFKNVWILKVKEIFQVFRGKLSKDF